MPGGSWAGKGLVMTHPTDEELEAMAARLEASAYVRSPAHEIEAAAMLRACKGITAVLEARAKKAEAALDRYEQWADYVF